MLIDETIFNEAKCENEHILKLFKEMGHSEDAENAVTSIYEPLIVHYEYQDVVSSPDDKKDYEEAYSEEGNETDALTDVIGADPVDDFLGNGDTLWFVPDATLLRKALMFYFEHLNPGVGFNRNASRFIRGLHDSKNLNGFFMTTGCGYDINDEFFAGVPIKHPQQPDGVGTGLPTKRFLKFINNNN